MKRLLSFLSRVERQRIADKIVECFNSINISSNTFVVNGSRLSNYNGETRFYERKEIDKAIENINALVDDLRGIK